MQRILASNPQIKQKQNISLNLLFWNLWERKDEFWFDNVPPEIVGFPGEKKGELWGMAGEESDMQMVCQL